MFQRKMWAVVFAMSLMTFALGAVSFAMSDKEQSLYSWKYKMTVSVETPEGIKTGSAVREVSVQMRPFPQDPRHPYRSVHSIKGEAVVVDLGERGVLFALLTGYLQGEDHGGSIVFDVFPGPPGLTPKGVEYYSTLKDAEATLTPTQYPMLVTFADIDDPMTVKEILEMKRDESDGRYPIKYLIKAGHFEKLFGKDVKLKEITIEMSDDSVLWEIDEWLLWLDDLKGGYLHGGFTSRNAPLGLHAGNFKRGDK